MLNKIAEYGKVMSCKFPVTDIVADFIGVIRTLSFCSNIRILDVSQTEKEASSLAKISVDTHSVDLTIIDRKMRHELVLSSYSPGILEEFVRIKLNELRVYIIE